MTDKYKNKYRIASARLQNWNYGANALYFVTICCKNRRCFFGDIANEKMILSNIGEMAEKYWLEIPQHFPFVVLHNHVIMPNHVHGIIEIAKPNNGIDDVVVGDVLDGGVDDAIVDGIDDGVVGDDDNGDGVETQNFASLRPNAMDATSRSDKTNPTSRTVKMDPTSRTDPTPTQNQNKNQFGPQSKNLASIVRGFKIGVTKNARQINSEFSWQPRYHDHIIRNNTAYQNISNYIINNPNNWKGDKFHSIN